MKPLVVAEPVEQLPKAVDRPPMGLEGLDIDEIDEDIDAEGLLRLPMLDINLDMAGIDL